MTKLVTKNFFLTKFSSDWEWDPSLEVTFQSHPTYWLKVTDKYGLYTRDLPKFNIHELLKRNSLFFRMKGLNVLHYFTTFQFPSVGLQSILGHHPRLWMSSHTAKEKSCPVKIAQLITLLHVSSWGRLNSVQFSSILIKITI